MVESMRFHVVIEEAEEGGFTAQCVEIPGAISEGETREELLENIQDAIRSVMQVRRVEAETSLNTPSRKFHKMESVDVDA